MPFKTSALEYQGNQKLKSTQIQKQKTMKKNTQNSKPNLSKENPFACNNRVTRRNFETLKIQTHKHKKEREKKVKIEGEKKITIVA